MKKYLFLLIVLILVFTGCELIPFAPTAKLSLTYSPNPAADPYYTSTNGWTWDITIRIRETEDVDVTIGNYGPDNVACISVFLTADNNVVSTRKYYKGDIEEWFGTAKINGSSSISYNASFSTTNYSEGKFVETYYGQDENGMTVSCSDTIELINNTLKR